MAYIIKGRVIGGNRIGRSLGFPTANITVGDTPGVRDGVYAATAIVDGTLYRGMANLGRRPSVKDFAAGCQGDTRLLEINLFGFDGELYGKQLEVELLDFVRPEMKFPSQQQLKAQVDQDRLRIEEYFKPK